MAKTLTIALTELAKPQHERLYPSEVQYLETINGVLWRWSQYYGKRSRIGLHYYSPKAFELFLSKERKDGSLIEDHVVPRRVIREMLFKFKSPDLAEVEIYHILSKYCMGVNILKTEDKKLNASGLKQKMPESWDKSDPWARYRAVKIPVVRVKWHDKSSYELTTILDF